MIRSRLTAQRLFALFLLGVVLFNFPVLHIFNRGGDVFGIPLLYAYLMVIWLVLIGLLAVTVEGGTD
jgi:hypothetical protein